MASLQQRWYSSSNQHISRGLGCVQTDLAVMKLSKIYEPNQYEADIYALWEKTGAFAPHDRGGKGSYSIVMPPPNANANMHIGYELTAALEDIAARYHRMKGEATLLLPGADHAGFETWVVYEKKLNKEGKSRFDFTREELYKQVWDFVALNRSNFEGQLRKIGASCDWGRFTFTLDKKIVSQAYATFQKMWNEGLIYRGERLVNFCTYHGTGFADIEVEYQESKGYLWHISYPLTDGSGEVVVATTRPETMLGDTAVAVHPDDKRYKHFVGKTVKLPLSEREIPIIADDFVDREFGTGAVKITPAHDQNDFEAAGRHDLPLVSVITHQGILSHHVPEPYRGLTVEEARAQVIADLDSGGNLLKVEDHTHSVGHCYKCGTVIQPLLREQWFVDMQPLAAKAIGALRDNQITFYPAAKKDQLINYLEGLRDWNISRQIAWGIPIPAFQNLEDPEDWIFDERVDQETIEKDGKSYRRDPDVFDTWFSSSSWPYATLDFPDGEDYKQFYPNSLMETGGEILYPWVSRMVMMGLYVTGDIPFREVYIHGYVMAEDGSKMSKSVGNTVDPMPVIDKYGSDALRMGVIAGRVPAVNRGYDSRKVEEARNFCNKLWNIARYVEDNVGDEYQVGTVPDPQTIADHWILQKLQHSTEAITEHLETYRFAEAYEELYHALWDNFADWYIEASKSHLSPSVLVYSLDTMLRLAHPFAPFVTETIWQTLKQDSLLITSSWPQAMKSDKKQAAEFDRVKEVVTEVRYVRTSLQTTEKLTLWHTGDDLLNRHFELVMSLARLASIEEKTTGKGVRLRSTDAPSGLEIDQETAENFRTKLETERLHQKAVVQKLKGRLANKAYTDKAPESVVEETRQQLAQAEDQLRKIIEQQSYFRSS